MRMGRCGDRGIGAKGAVMRTERCGSLWGGWGLGWVVMRMGVCGWGGWGWREGDGDGHNGVEVMRMEVLIK